MRAAVVLVLLSILFWPLVGCKQDQERPPTTHKVEGKVVYRDGKAFTTGGAIEFRHETVDGAASRGTIKPDGTFDLYTMTAQNKLPGAQEGSHIVTIFPTTTDKTAQPISVKKKYVIVAGDNSVTVQLND